MSPKRIPLATYRLQFNKNFTFSHAAGLVPYLAKLGVSHCYASPYLRARPGSTHGYDIIDHNHLNPEIGSPEDYERFIAALRQHGMGQILDIVPNHMGVMGSDNVWWLDMLENGQASSYAEFFDIDWEPQKDELHGKVLLPILGDQYGTVLDRGELKLIFDKKKGEFSIFYFQHCLPVNPREYPRIMGRQMDRLEQQLGAQNEDLLELQNLVASFSHLPARNDPEPEKRVERSRDKKINKKRLAALCARSPAIAEFINQNVAAINGTAGDSASFDELHELIKAQAYRLAYWRVAADDINYRRFFDINELAGLRMESPGVFEATHGFVLQLLRECKIDGLRIDHPDGLYNPAQYLSRLQQSQMQERQYPAEVYVVVEKILTGKEKLRKDWPIDGTTGYDFANMVNALFVDPAASGRMDRIYRGFVGRSGSYDHVVYNCKKLVIRRALASELNVLANLLSHIALANRHTCDFTLNSLRAAITEVVACFPVYRTYITPTQVSDADRKYVESAVRLAKERGAGADTSIFDFVQDVLLTRLAEGQDKPYRGLIIRFAMKFQQFSSAVMAKGLEDTAFYRYNRLVSLNEVGGNPGRFGIEPEVFHDEIQQRAMVWPHSMLATSTHDSKRSEDVRARINVLSEIPEEWRKAIRNWRALNQVQKKIISGAEAPSRNDEYLFYQTLVGTWPLRSHIQPGSLMLAPTPGAEFIDRIKQYMIKAVREAKEKTSWANRNPEYEYAVIAFVERVLAANENKFLERFLAFAERVAGIGLLNSLGQTLVKLVAPGVPDIYQGNELWEFSLVDPDNRHAVDYVQRQRVLDEFERWGNLNCECARGKLQDLIRSITDGRAKLYCTWKVLGARKQHCELFQDGSYQPLRAEGEKAKHAFAFARATKNAVAICAVPRLSAGLIVDSAQGAIARAAWGDTRVEIPDAAGRHYRNIFDGEVLQIQAAERSTCLAADLFASFPIALLIAEG